MQDLTAIKDQSNFALSEKRLPNKLLKKQAVFLYIEVMSDFIRASVFKLVNPSQKQTKKVFLLNSVQTDLVDQDLNSMLLALNKLLKSIKGFRYPVIISLSHKLATTFQSGVSLIRKGPLKDPIDETDLENLLAKGIWKIFNTKQKAASRKMAVSTIEIGLANAQVISIKLDRHKVMNPIGFSARSLEVWCRETILLENLVEEVKKIFPKEDLISSEEAGGLTACAIQDRFQQKAIFVNVLKNQTILYQISPKGRVKYLDSISWGLNSLIGAVVKSLAVSDIEADLILNRFETKAASKKVIETIKEIVSGELGLLLNSIKSHSKPGAKEKVYLHSYLPLPNLIKNPSFLKKLKYNLPLIILDKDFVGKNFNFELKLSQLESKTKPKSYPYSFALVLMSINEVFSKVINQDLVKIAKRRVRWLQN